MKNKKILPFALLLASPPLLVSSLFTISSCSSATGPIHFKSNITDINSKVGDNVSPTSDLSREIVNSNNVIVNNVSFSLSGRLPNWLIFNKKTVIISGSATESCYKTTYYVTATYNGYVCQSNGFNCSLTDLKM